MVSQKHRLSTRFIQRQNRALGNTVTVVEVARDFSDDAYREQTETFTEHTGVYCTIHILTEQEVSQDEGEAKAGDLIFNFDYSYESILKHMNRIIYDGRTFQISDVRKFDAIGNTTYLITCFTKKYSDGTAWKSTKTEVVNIGPIVKKLYETIKLVDTKKFDITTGKKQTLELNDSVSPKITARIVTDSLTVNDTKTKQIGKNLTESFELSEGGQKVINKKITNNLNLASSPSGTKI